MAALQEKLSPDDFQAVKMRIDFESVMNNERKFFEAMEAVNAELPFGWKL